MLTSICKISSIDFISNLKGVIFLRLEQLYFFTILLQENSYNKAAAKLHITQPALTYCIKSMEKELGVRLLTRNTQGFSLTEDGKNVLEFSLSVTNQYQDLVAKLQKPDTAYTDNISILAAPLFADLILEPFLESLYKKCGRITAYLIKGEKSVTVQQYLSIHSSFAIINRLSHSIENNNISYRLENNDSLLEDDFVYIPLFQDTIGVCMGRLNKLANISEITYTTLTELHLPLTTFGIEQFPIGNPQNKLVLSSNNTTFHIRSMNELGAVCCLYYYVYKQYFAEDDSVVWRPFSENITETYYLIYPKEHTLTIAEQNFIEELQFYLIQAKLK